MYIRKTAEAKMTKTYKMHKGRLFWGKNEMDIL